jgi:hypothetical protein
MTRLFGLVLALTVLAGCGGSDKVPDTRWHFYAVAQDGAVCSGAGSLVRIDSNHEEGAWTGACNRSTSVLFSGNGNWSVSAGSFSVAVGSDGINCPVEKMTSYTPDVYFEGECAGFGERIWHLYATGCAGCTAY